MHISIKRLITNILLFLLYYSAYYWRSGCSGRIAGAMCISTYEELKRLISYWSISMSQCQQEFVVAPPTIRPTAHDNTDWWLANGNVTRTKLMRTIKRWTVNAKRCQRSALEAVVTCNWVSDCWFRRQINTTMRYIGASGQIQPADIHSCC